MEQHPRNYTGSDVDMIITISTISENAIANKAFLQTKRSTWKDPFFETLEADIDQAAKDHLGVDSAKDLRAATVAVNGIQQAAGTLLAELKVQIAEDFKADKPRRDELLKTLGFTTYLKHTQKGDQEALINLLYQFSTNMNATVQAEITNKGTDAATITAISGYARQMKDANVTQETFKAIRKGITAAGVAAFNGVYDRTISVAKIAAKFFKSDPAKAAMFSYNKIRKSLSGGTAKAKNTPPAPVVG